MILAALAVVCALLLSAMLVMLRRSHRPVLGTAAQRLTFDVLHTASLAAPGLREGLTAGGAERAVRHLRTLLDAPAIAITDHTHTLARDGQGHGHEVDPFAHARGTLASGRTSILPGDEMGCTSECPIRVGVAVPLVDGEAVVGVLLAYARETSAVLVRAVEEVASWVSGQLELGSAEVRRRMLTEAELRALRAQISPHFIYNSLNAVASFVRTDPGRARELLLEFADFTRYALRHGGDYATLADELRNTERYLMLEQARFGDRLRVSLRLAPEVLSITVPFLVVQPLVENAVQHGLDVDREVVTVSIVAADDGPTALLTVEDDGAGADPDVVRAALKSDPTSAPSHSVGLGNIDSRLRKVFGDSHGLIVETAPGAGTKVTVRIPKFAPGIQIQ